MNQISEYDNIFHYFKGQTSQLSSDFQNENNTTKALINVLQHGSKHLTIDFVRLIDKTINLRKNNDFTYMIQVTEKLNELAKQGLVLGIAEDIEKRISSKVLRSKSVPDAAIVSDDIVILIETKVGENSNLDTSQLEKHKEKFHKEQECRDNFEYLSWHEIRILFKEKQKEYHSDTVTGFLLRQFEQFCQINGIGGISRDDSLNYFPLKGRGIASEIDKYLWSGIFNIFEPPNTKKGLAYKRNERSGGFAKLCVARKCLILRFGSKGSNLGVLIQKDIDTLLKKQYPRSKTDNNKYAHEAFVDLRWVKDLEEIKAFIKKAYEHTP